MLDNKRKVNIEAEQGSHSFKRRSGSATISRVNSLTCCLPGNMTRRVFKNNTLSLHLFISCLLIRLAVDCQQCMGRAFEFIRQLPLRHNSSRSLLLPLIHFISGRIRYLAVISSSDLLKVSLDVDLIHFRVHRNSNMVHVCSPLSLRLTPPGDLRDRSARIG